MTVATASTVNEDLETSLHGGIAGPHDGHSRTTDRQ